MTDPNSTSALVAPSDIALMANVSRGAVSNWQKRHRDFPRPVAGTTAKPLFLYNDVAAWLEQRGIKLVKDSGANELWAVLNSMRDRHPEGVLVAMVLDLALKREQGIPLAFAQDVPDQVAIDNVLAGIDPDKLADVVDEILERDARSQVRSGGESGFVGSRTSRLLAGAALGAIEQLDLGDEPVVVRDDACGIAVALLDVASGTQQPLRLYGQDIDARTLEVAETRARLRGIDVVLESTDVLVDGTISPHKADVVLLEPPLGMRGGDASSWVVDPRFQFGTPSRNHAEMAWIQHAIAQLSESGRAFVLTGHGPISSGGKNSRIRRELVSRGCVEAIIGLPGKMLPFTSIPLVLWVLRAPTVPAGDDSSRLVARGPVLMVDASEVDTPEQYVASWLVEDASMTDVPHRRVDRMLLVNSTDVDLTPTRWITQAERHPEEIIQEYQEARESLEGLLEQARNHDFPQIPWSLSDSRKLSIRELQEAGIIERGTGHPEKFYREKLDLPTDSDVRLIAPKDVRDNEGFLLASLDLAMFTDPKPRPEGKYFTRPRDVLVSSIGSLRAALDGAGGHLLGSGVEYLRVKNSETLDPEYLRMVIGGSWNQGLHTGSTIPRIPVQNLVVPMLPLAQQRRVLQITEELEQVESIARGIQEFVDDTRQAILDAIHYNVVLEPNDGSSDAATAGEES